MKPIFVGLGTAAVLAAGGASAIAAEEAPTLTVKVTADGPVSADESAAVVTTVTSPDGTASKVQITKVTLTPATVKPEVTEGCKTACDLGEVGEAGKTAESLVSVADDIEKPVTVTVTVAVEGTVNETPATGAGEGTVQFKDVAPDPPTETPTKTPTKTPDDPPSSSKPPPDKPSPTGSSGGGSGGSGGGGSAGGSGSTSGGGSGGGSGGDGSSVSDGGAVVPQPNSSFDAEKPEVALPPIQAPDPSVAPGQGSGATPQSRLQGNEAPVAQDLTFERMASTQIAWLAALLVAFSLLLTQVRLGRRRLRPAGAARRVKGTHRRPRKGMFGK